MITNTDITKLKEVFATKEALENLDIRTAAGFAESEKTFNRIENELVEIKNHIITMEDNILGAINKLQNENTITSSYSPRIDNHEKRITKIETVMLAN